MSLLDTDSRRTTSASKTHDTTSKAMLYRDISLPLPGDHCGHSHLGLENVLSQTSFLRVKPHPRAIPP
jgi:hypothetical protein